MSPLLGNRADAWFDGLSMEVLVELSTQIVTQKQGHRLTKTTYGI